MKPLLRWPASPAPARARLPGGWVYGRSRTGICFLAGVILAVELRNYREQRRQLKMHPRRGDSPLPARMWLFICLIIYILPLNWPNTVFLAQPCFCSMKVRGACEDIGQRQRRGRGAEEGDGRKVPRVYGKRQRALREGVNRITCARYAAHGD